MWEMELAFTSASKHVGGVIEANYFIIMIFNFFSFL